MRRGEGCAGGACGRHPRSGEEDSAGVAGGEREGDQDTALGGEALGDTRIAAGDAADGSDVQAVLGAPG